MMLKLSYTKSGVGLFEIGFLVCPIRIGGPRQPCIGQYGIEGVGSHAHLLT